MGEGLGDMCLALQFRNKKSPKQNLEFNIDEEALIWVLQQGEGGLLAAVSSRVYLDAVASSTLMYCTRQRNAYSTFSTLMCTHRKKSPCHTSLLSQWWNICHACLTVNKRAAHKCLKIFMFFVFTNYEIVVDTKFQGIQSLLYLNPMPNYYFRFTPHDLVGLSYCAKLRCGISNE